MPSSNTRMQGKVCLVTGANSGIGKATALGLARMGATVVMVCRDRVRGAEAQQEINTILRFMSSRFGSVEKGAQTSIYLASSPEVETITGKYFVKSAPKRSAARSYDESLQHQLLGSKCEAGEIASKNTNVLIYGNRDANYRR
jgi:nucleoside-diphosphate-sugar epimerase